MFKFSQFRVDLAALFRRIANRLHPREQELKEFDTWQEHSEDDFKKKCYDAALAVSEDDVEGFLLLILRPEEGGATGDSELMLKAVVPDGSWPAFLEAMRQIETCTQEHGPPQG